MSEEIVYYGNPILALSAKKITEFTPDVVSLVNEMQSILSKANGVGLAAPQVGISKRIIVIDLSHKDDGPVMAFINPMIVWRSEEIVAIEEGCLSVPGIFIEIERPEKIKVKANTVQGKEIEFTADGFFSRVLQHEIDHLDGVLFIDHVDDAVRSELTSELKKIKKMNKK